MASGRSVTLDDMLPTPRTRLRRSIASAVTLAVVAASLAVVTAPAVSAIPACSTAETQVWLGLGLGGGTAGTTYYPLELSNIAKHACTLYGYPGVSAFGAGPKQVGPAASRLQLSHAVVTLGPGATAHAILGFHDAGAVCSHAIDASGLRVYPPGQKAAGEIDFPFQVCAHGDVLVVGPVRAGTGIPGYTSP